MSAPQDAPLPVDLNLWAGCIVRVTAVDATTGNLVNGVVLSNVSLEVANLTGGDLGSGVFTVVEPVLVPKQT